MSANTLWDDNFCLPLYTHTVFHWQRSHVYEKVSIKLKGNNIPQTESFPSVLKKIEYKGKKLNYTANVTLESTRTHKDSP